MVCLAVFMRALPGPRTIDDAFITFRYSRNLLAGQGFVYNLGSPVLGTTTPLFTVIMAAIGGLLNGRDFPHYAIWVSALADAITCSLLFLIVYQVTKHRAPATVIGVLWAVAPQSVTFAVGGMETSVTILWATAATYAYLQGWKIGVGLFAALGILTRIDSAIWIGLLFAHQLWSGLRATPRQLPLRTWITTALILGPWFILSYFYFGSIIPRSVTAKSAVYIMPPGTALVTLIQNLSDPFSAFETFRSIAPTIGFIAYPVLIAIGGLYAVKRVPGIAAWLVYPFVYSAIFAVANPLIFRWYLTPPLPPYMVGIVIGGWALLTGLGGKRREQALRIARVGMSGLAVFWVGTQLNAWTLTPDHGNRQRPAPKMAWHLLELHYQEIAETLKTTYGVTSQSRVASADIGVVGYFTNSVIIDTVGLVTPEMSRYYPADPKLIVEGQNYAVPPAIIQDFQPEYLVVMEGMVRYGCQRDPYFIAHYELRRTIPFDYYGTGMLMFRRLPAP
jgi:hypothetical protein